MITSFSYRNRLVFQNSSTDSRVPHFFVSFTVIPISRR